jgi:hypothetical protein
MKIHRSIVMLAAAAGLFVAAPAQAEPRELPAYHAVSEDFSEQRRAVYVRVDRRIDEEDLLRIAAQVEARGKKPFARTYVNFILPGMPVNQGAWASVLFAPEPKVMVHGLSRLDEEMFLSEHRADTRPLLGSWLTSPPAAPGRLTIYSDHGKVFAEWRLRGGQKTVDELHDTTTKSARRFDVPGGGYYVLTRSGELEIWDKSTLIATAERIRPEHLALPAMASNKHTAPVRVTGKQPVPAPQVSETLPSSPVQPEPAAAPVRAASSTSAPAVVPAPDSTPAPAAAKPAPAALAAVVEEPEKVPKVIEPEPVEPKVKAKKAAKAKPRQNKATAAKVAAVSKVREMTTGDMVSAKIAGKM